MNLRKSTVISLAGHITVFGIFSFSFGIMIPKAPDSGASFYGAFLRHSQVVPAQTHSPQSRVKEFFSRFSDSVILPEAGKDYALQLSGYYLKPAQNLSSRSEKAAFNDKPLVPLPLALPVRQPSIIFHPLLPYSFTLYFKDRQTAHVELTFNVGSSGLKKTIEVKRKISSGNLEVDLLTSRYISHYLFIQQANFAGGSWQTVKIDLSARND